MKVLNQSYWKKYEQIFRTLDIYYRLSPGLTRDGLSKTGVS